MPQPLGASAAPRACCSRPGPGRALAVAVHQRAEAGERLLAGHLLLDDRRHQRLQHPVAAAQPPVGVPAVDLGEHRVARLEAARVVVGAEQRGHRLERPVGARTPRLGAPPRRAGAAPATIRVAGPGRRTDAAPVPRSGPVALDAVGRVAAAAALLAQDRADRARPRGRHTRT